LHKCCTARPWIRPANFFEKIFEAGIHWFWREAGCELLHTYFTQIRQSQEAVDARFQDYAMNPTELHRWVADYNWDDGLDPIWVIADSRTTEFATALMIYWRLDGPWLDAAPDEARWEAKHLQDVVRECLLNGFYSRGASTFGRFPRLSCISFAKPGCLTCCCTRRNLGFRSRTDSPSAGTPSPTRLSCDLLHSCCFAADPG
jgi:hypothetical protein